MAASGHATCHVDISTGSADADVIMTSALTWSTLTESVVNGSTARSAGSMVSGSHQTVSQETLTCGAHVSSRFKRKEKEAVKVNELKEQTGRLGSPNSARLGVWLLGPTTWSMTCGSAWLRLDGPARFHGSTRRPAWVAA